MKIVLFDRLEALAKEWEGHRIPEFKESVEVVGDVDIRKLSPVPGTALVSASNSFQFYDGGLDLVYLGMFPELERDAKAFLKRQGRRTVLRRPYLPIGHAMTIPVSNGVFVIAAPTMFLPADVSDTHNSYHATYAAVRAAVDDTRIKLLLVPGMATGIGRMDCAEAAKQMWEAMDDAISGRPPKYAEKEIVLEQPREYANRELFDTVFPGLWNSFTMEGSTQRRS